MRPRTVLVLLLLVAGLGAFVWLYERELPGSDERVERAKEVFPGLAPEEVTRVTITAPAGAVELERPAAPEPETAAEAQPWMPAARSWRLVRPVAAPADGSRVDGLLATLAGLQKLRTLEDVDPAAVGLETPEARLELESATGKHTLLVGREVPAGGGRIVGTGEGPPYFVVAASFEADLERAPGDWRSHDLFLGDRAAIERLTIGRDPERVLLARRGEEFWVETPYVDRADRGTVNRLLGALTGLRAERFVDQPPAGLELGLAPPAVVVEAVLEGEAEPFRVELGAAVPDEPERLYARVAGRTVEVGKALAETVVGGAADWRSLAWASLEVFEIDRVEVTQVGAAPLRLERTEGDWQRDGQQIDFSAASDFLYALTGVKADTVGEPMALAEPQLHVVLEGAERSETLELFAPRETGRPARVTGREVVLWLNAEGVEEVERRLSDLRAAPVAPTSEAASDEPIGAPSESE